MAKASQAYERSAEMGDKYGKCKAALAYRKVDIYKAWYWANHSDLNQTQPKEYEAIRKETEEQWNEDIKAARQAFEIFSETDPVESPDIRNNYAKAAYAYLNVVKKSGCPWPLPELAYLLICEECVPQDYDEGLRMLQEATLKLLGRSVWHKVLE